MSIYRYNADATLVDAEPAPVGIVVHCGPDRSSVVICEEYQWIVLTPDAGYEVWQHTDFHKNFSATRAIRATNQVEDALRTCGLARVRGMALERCA
jgi:hypothetical protein